MTIKTDKSYGLLLLEGVVADLRHWGQVSKRDYPRIIERLERIIRELQHPVRPL